MQNTTLEGPFVHMVFFWLKEPDNQGDKERFYKILSHFVDRTPGIKRKHIGTPADTSRPVIDSSYAYSLVVTFDSKKEHDEYQDHPYHKEFIAEGQKLWSHVQVYDSILS